MTLNVELLEKTMQYILDHPEQHDQKNWVIEYECGCGTTACFAGWACFLSDKATHLGGSYFRIDGWRYHAEEAAIELLGLEHDQARLLFYASRTVEQLQILVKEFVNSQ